VLPGSIAARGGDTTCSLGAGDAGLGAGGGGVAETAARGVSTGAAAATGAGEYTGGSSRTVYSRSRRPRGQLASTSSVTNGSVTGRGEVTLSTSRPPERVTRKVKSER
jgi:hypothetical protein